MEKSHRMFAEPDLIQIGFIKRTPHGRGDNRGGEGAFEK